MSWLYNITCSKEPFNPILNIKKTELLYFGTFCFMFSICWGALISWESYHIIAQLSAPNLCKICENALKAQNQSSSVVIGCIFCASLHNYPLLKGARMKSNLEEWRKEKKSQMTILAFLSKPLLSREKAQGKVMRMQILRITGEFNFSDNRRGRNACFLFP